MPPYNSLADSRAESWRERRCPMLLLAKHMLLRSRPPTESSANSATSSSTSETGRSRNSSSMLGTWLHRRRVTLPPDMLREKDWADHRLAVTGLTRQQVVSMPGAENARALRRTERVGRSHHRRLAGVLDRHALSPLGIRDDPRLHNTQEMPGITSRPPTGRSATWPIS